MLKRIFSEVMLTLLLLSMLTLTFNIQPAKAGTITVPDDYLTIQEAINAASPGDTIFVREGTYYEHVVVNKSVSLIGEDRNNTIIDGRGAGTVLVIGADDVALTGFTIQNASYCGIIGHIPFAPYFPRNVAINNNKIRDIEGIAVKLWGDVRFFGNVITTSEIGLLILGDNNTIIDNTIEKCSFGVNLKCDNSLFRNNRIIDNEYNFGVSSFYGGAAISSLPDIDGNDIDASNTINGKPILFIVNQTDLVFSPSTYANAGYLGLVGCSNITVKNMILQNNMEGLLLHKSINITVSGNIITNNSIGISAFYSNKTSIMGNDVSNNLLGIHLRVNCRDNVVIENEISDNYLPIPYQRPHVYRHPLQELHWYAGGIAITFASGNNTIVANHIVNNQRGMFFDCASNNLLRYNNMTGNWFNFGVYGFVLKHFIHDVDPSNLVEKKPVYYWIDKHNVQVPNDAGYVALVESSNITIKNLNITHNYQGVLLVGTNDTVVTGCTITECVYGVQILTVIESFRPPPLITYHSLNNTIKNSVLTNNCIGVSSFRADGFTMVLNCMISNNSLGIYADGSNNYVANNLITDNSFAAWKYGFYLCPEILMYPFEGGITICGTACNTFDNIITNNSAGIRLSGFCGPTTNNILSQNSIENNEYGVWLAYSSNNRIYSNNFINNTYHVYDLSMENRTLPSINVWDDGYPSGGNYWSDYNGVDLFSGSYQNVAGSDSIGDTPYVIDENNQDNYPLIASFNSFTVAWDGRSYPVDFVSNSTISNLNFDGIESMLSFNVSGPDDTLGICRVTVPKSLMELSQSEKWQITIDGSPPLSTNIIENENYTYLYFTYEHSIHKVEIRIISEKIRTLLGVGWGWMRIAPKQYVYGQAELYKVGDTQIELVITYQGEEYSRTWNIIYHREYKYGERYLCYSEEWGFLIVGLHKRGRWQFWYAVGKGAIAFGFQRFQKLRLMPV